MGNWPWDLRTGSVQWSAEFHRIHGVDPFEFDGTLASHLNSVHPDYREEMHLLMEESAASGRPFESEYRILRSDGTVRILKVRAHPVGGVGGRLGGRAAGDRPGRYRLDRSELSLGRSDAAPGPRRPPRGEFVSGSASII